MSGFQKTIKYLAMAFAIFLAVNIIGGILSAVGLVGGLLDGLAGGDVSTADMKSYEISADIHSLEIELNAADFIIKKGNRLSVESNIKHLSVEEKNGVLKIEDEKVFSGKYSGAVLTLCLPEGAVFEKADLSMGAGRLTADSLTAGRLELELGAGEATIGRLVVAERAVIDGGVGKLVIEDGALHNLDLDMGIGQLILKTALSGSSKFDMGIGDSQITVIGSRKDYRPDIEKGVGRITVDGVSVSDFTESQGGERRIAISGGVGSVSLSFTE